MTEKQIETYEVTVETDGKERMCVEGEEIDLFLKQKNQLKKWETSYENIRKSEDKKRKKKREKANKQYSELYYSIATYFENISEEEQKIMRAIAHENAKRAECDFSIRSSSDTSFFSICAIILAALSLIGIIFELPKIFYGFETIFILIFVIIINQKSGFREKYRIKGPFYALVEGIIENHLEAP